MGCPTIAVLERNLTFTIQAKDGTGAAADATGFPAYSIYEDETGTAIVTGSLAKLDDAGTLGLYSEQIACTTALGYERYKTYTINITATVDGIAVAKSYAFLVLGGSDLVSSTTAALTTTANFKTYIGETGSDNDTLIAALIMRATKEIQNYTHRTLLSTTFRELYDHNDDNEILLKEYPVTDIDFIATTREDAMYVKNTSTDAHRAGVSIEDSTLAAPTMKLEVYGGTNDGSNSITLSDHTTLTALVVAINALGSGWSATVTSTYGNYEPVELIPTGNLHCLNETAYLEAPSEPIDKYRIDFDAGIITLRHNIGRGTKKVVVKYTAGYTTTPADLEQICIDIVKVYYDARTKDSSVESKKLGDFAYKLHSSSGLALTGEIKKRLGTYRKWGSGGF